MRFHVSNAQNVAHGKGGWQHLVEMQRDRSRVIGKLITNVELTQCLEADDMRWYTRTAEDEAQMQPL